LTAVAARFSPLSSGTAWVCVLAGVSLLCAALVAGGLWRVPRAERSRNIALLLYCLLPILLVFLLSQITRSLYINRVFTNSSVVVPLVFAYPLALRKGRRERILYGFLGIVLALTTALSAFGYLRDQEKEDWRGAATSLLRIPERNRLIVFAPTAGEILFDYYAQRFPRLGPSVAKMGLPMSHLEDFPPRLGAITSLNDIAPLKLAVESGKYSEIDLVLSTESPDDLNRLILDYLNQVSIRRLDQQFRGVRIERFLAPRH
jgi:hypothetical protein